IAEAHLLHAGLDPEAPGVARVARELPLHSVLVGRRALHDLQLGMGGEHLVVHAADPVAARPDLAVRHGEEGFAERRAERLGHLLRRVERNAADEMKLTRHGASSWFAGAVIEDVAAAGGGPFR